jgi:2'-5' RNA ligase
VLWVGVEGDLPRLHHLQTALTDGLKQHGFPVEARAFSPHITLARRRDTADSGLPPAWPPATQAGPRAAPLNRLILFHSQLARTGARYTPVAQFALASDTRDH